MDNYYLCARKMTKVKLPKWSLNLIKKLKQLYGNPRFSKALSIISVIYPLTLLYLSRKEILKLEWSSFLRVFLLSLLIYYISMSLQNIVWSLIIDGKFTRFLSNSQVYFQTVLMKKLPGGVWHWLGRSSIYEVDFPDENRAVSKSNFIEWLILILTGLVGYLFTISPYLGVISFFFTVAITTWLLRRNEESLIKPLRLAVCIVILYLICWLAGGQILYWLLTEVQTTALVTFKTSFAIWCLSSAISMLLFIFPSGALIRDFSLAALMTNQIELSKVSLVILQVRVIFLAADLFWSFLSLQFLKLKKVRNTPKAN